MSAAGKVEVRVVYAERDRYIAVKLRVGAGETVGDVVRRCGVLRLCPPGFDPLRGTGSVGIFGERVALDAVPSDGDCIEIYRPLRHDPMEARRRRAAGQS